MKKWLIILVIAAMCGGLVIGGLSALFSTAEDEPEPEETVTETVPVYTTREKIYAQNHPDLSEEEVRQQVWLGLDQDNWAHANTASNPDDILVFVNKHWKLPEDYVPQDLTTLSERVEGATFQLRKEAAEAYEALQDEADAQDIMIGAVGGYMSREEAQELYDKGVEKQGKASAEMLFAPADFNEYETGLVVDIWIDGQGDNISDIASSEHYDWLVNKAAEHGFIVRYKDEDMGLTQYGGQPWRFRYVGKDVAKELKESGQSFDAYMAEKNAG